MKNLKRLLNGFLLLLLTISLSSSLPSSKIEEVLETKNDKSVNLSSMTVKELISFSSKQYKEQTGVKLKYKERIVLNMIQKDLKKQVKENKLDENTVVNFKSQMAEGEKSFNIGGFLLGLLLGLIGVGLAHIFSTDKGFRRSSWQGFGAWIILILVLAFVV